MNIYLSSRTINTLCAIGCLCKPKVLAKNVAREAANHAVREVFDYLNVKDLKVMVNRLLEIGQMIKEMDNE